MASTNQPQQFLQIAQHDKFYSKLLSKETSLANPSFRMYYGRASVPFVWESQPGTPKRAADPTAPLAPLTPPPSYHFDPKRLRNHKLKPAKSNLIHCLKRNNSTTTSTRIASSLSSSSSFSSSGSCGRRYTSPRSSFSSSSAEGGSPRSTLRAGCYSMMLVKNVLLSIVGGGGQGSSGHDTSS